MVGLQTTLWGIPYWGWGVGAVAGIGGWYWYTSSQQAAQDAQNQSLGADQYGFPPGGIALQPPIGNAGVGGGGITTPDAGGATIDAMLKAIGDLNPPPDTQVQLHQIDANAQATIGGEGTTIFNSLIKSLDAHKGLGRISADVPGVGDVSVWYGKPTVTKTKTIIKKVPAPTPIHKPTGGATQPAPTHRPVLSTVEGPAPTRKPAPAPIRRPAPAPKPKARRR
jgi:hypothetical protein